MPVFDEAADLLLASPECVVPHQVVEELERILTDRRLHKRRAARLALEAVRRSCRVEHVEDADSADDALVLMALRDPELIVATADNELRRRLRELGLPNIYYRRSRRGLMVEA